MSEDMFGGEERYISSYSQSEDADIENTLRPKHMDEYIGQSKVKEQMGIYIEAARQRGESLDHVLLYGPPGLGKTTLAMALQYYRGGAGGTDTHHIRPGY